MTDAGACPICHQTVGQQAVTLRYESRLYTFDRLSCKRIFQENPDRFLDAQGDVLPEPR